MYRDALATLVRGLDAPHSTSFSHDDLTEWEPGAADSLAAAGLIREGPCATSVRCDGCENDCIEDVVFAGGAGGSPVRAYVICHNRDDIGRVEIPLTRLRTWVPDLTALAGWLAEQLGVSAAPEECIPGRLWWLGRPEVNGWPMDSFLVRGARWPAAKTAFARSGRLRECVAPLLFVPHEIPRSSVFGESALVVSLARIARMDGGVLQLDHSAIQVGDKPPAKAAERAFQHSPDFRSVSLHGEEFALTTQQARVVQALSEVRQTNTPDLSQEYIMVEVLDSNQTRLRDVFRNSRAWGRLIVPGKTKGTFRLDI